MRSGMRGFTDRAVTFLDVAATVVVIAPLMAIFDYLVYKGASSLNLDFFTQIPKPPGETGGGMANSIVGSAVLLALASVIGVPIGIGGGIFLAGVWGGGASVRGRCLTGDCAHSVPSTLV